MTISIADWRYQSRIKLAEVSETAEIEINAVLSKVLSRNLPWCLANSNIVLDPNIIEELNKKIDFLRSGIPLGYVLGEIEFFGLNFIIDENVLIPRPETELMVEAAIGWLDKYENAKKLVDVGCGSGAIIISLLKKFPDKKGWAVEISRAALNVSKKNMTYHEIKNLNFVQLDCLTGLQTKFDVITANLPYIPGDVLKELPVSKYEPEIALNGGKDGLEVINKLIDQIPSRLNSPGLVLLEIQFDQAEKIIHKLQDSIPEAIISIIKDYSNHDRIIQVEV
ncbi:MAG: peptide chain release factor N(5)-glutamine methyltransferase [Anaerolineaceae bacterium]|jgi:release factor glutamine methyltransferase|nr:peptide chain release factor N(5)-glutamine methyltransferase [Anaerolineaceae bacterium]